MVTISTLWVCIIVATSHQGGAITVATYPQLLTTPKLSDSRASPQQHLYRPALVPPAALYAATHANRPALVAPAALYAATHANRPALVAPAALYAATQANRPALVAPAALYAATHANPHLPNVAQRISQYATTLLPQQTVANARITHDLAGVPTVPPNILAASKIVNRAKENPIVFVSYPGGHAVSGRSSSGVAVPAVRFPAPPPAQLYSRNPKVIGTSRLPAAATISHQQHALGSIDRQYDSSESQSVRGPLPSGPQFNDNSYRAGATTQNLKQAKSRASSGTSAGAHDSSGGGHSAGGKKGGHHHDTAHHTLAGKKGGEGKEREESEYSEGGGKKASHHDSGSHGGAHGEYGGGGSEGGHKAGGHKKAAGWSKGFRDQYHKDEYRKQAKFWNDGHESGKYEKFGNKGSGHYGGNGAHKKGETHHAGSSGSKHGKKGQSAGGHNHSDQSGHKAEKGSSQQSGHEADYAQKGGSQHSKKHGDAAYH